MPLQPETPPSPMPGAKKSAPDKGDPRADTNNNSNAAKPDPDRGNKLHDALVQHFAPVTGNKQEESALNELDGALKTTPNLDQ